MLGNAVHRRYAETTASQPQPPSSSGSQPQPAAASASQRQLARHHEPVPASRSQPEMPQTAKHKQPRVDELGEFDNPRLLPSRWLELDEFDYPR